MRSSRHGFFFECKKSVLVPMRWASLGLVKSERLIEPRYTSEPCILWATISMPRCAWLSKPIFAHGGCQQYCPHAKAAAVVFRTSLGGTALLDDHFPSA